ncbi:uncharacterized protein LOC114713409 isoform X2 [Neltuma alba]|uniref:uncharacterized protein LOC114713409 isoform X2 n=1 Tax=Neltuma alba TaxID=207710 RepID=UPI0010A3E1E3|nr:uncharacterized protein LOC114713409 isoform X2 [Prosopis alba]
MPFILLINSTSVMTDRCVSIYMCDRVFWLKFANNILANMKFKKGTKVEVLSKTEVPSGSWRCAVIICGNGHHYSVRYDGYDGAPSKEIAERVPRKSIRPCPPVLEATEDWRPGDVVEVCRNSSWSMATVLKVLGTECILVRLLGSSLEFKVNKFDIRVRQSWLDGKWIVVGKGTSRCESGKRDDTLAPKLYLMSSARGQQTTLKTKRSFDHDYLHDQKKVNVLNSHLGSRTLKRSSHSQVGLYEEPPLKLRATNNEGRYQRARVACPPRGIQVEEYRENFETNDADEVSSSVCSCSINDCNLNKARYLISAGLVEDLEGATSDAESACHSRYEEGSHSLLSEEEMAAEIHRLELHAYRCTIEALHASGPLSWELEALMTNLRLSLHISNDEHLMEIRNLISSENSIPVK